MTNHTLYKIIVTGALGMQMVALCSSDNPAPSAPIVRQQSPFYTYPLFFISECGALIRSAGAGLTSGVVSCLERCKRKEKPSHKVIRPEKPRQHCSYDDPYANARVATKVQQWHEAKQNEAKTYAMENSRNPSHRPNCGCHQCFDHHYPPIRYSY